MSDRRAGNERRLRHLVPEPLARVRADRRDHERRDSPRVAHRFWVRSLDADAGLSQVYEGDLGLGGVTFWTPYPPSSQTVEVGLRIFSWDDEFKATGRVVREYRDDGMAQVHVIFDELPIQQELALARYLARTVRAEVTRYFTGSIDKTREIAHTPAGE